MPHDPADLVGKEPGVHRVVDGAMPGDAEPGLEMGRAVPGECRDPVARTDPVLLQAPHETPRPLAQDGIRRARQRAVGLARDDDLGGKLGAGVIEDTMQPQWPVLHQAEHGILRAEVSPDPF